MVGEFLKLAGRLGLSFGAELFCDGFITSTESFHNGVNQLHESLDSESAKAFISRM